jgi:hypothetical protein
MIRPRILTALLASGTVAVSLQVVSLRALPVAGRTAARPGSTAVQDCRTMATAATTRTKGTGFSAETTTACGYDKTVNQSTCRNKYSDSVGTASTTVSITSFASLADAIDEASVSPPRRRSLRTDTTVHGARGETTSSLVNTYDQQNRLVQEVGQSSGGGTFTTTYTSWDEAGRPTAGNTVTLGGINALRLTYNTASRTVTTTTESGGQQLVCALTFDANGHPAATTCKGPGGMTNSSTTTITASERVCR